MLDREALFYLKSRGIPAAEAKALLIRSFLSAALEPLTHDGVRALYAARLAAWLGAPEEADAVEMNRSADDLFRVRARLEQISAIG